MVKDVGKHHFIHLSHHPSIPSSFVYSDGAKKEWNIDAARRRIIYISVVILFFNFGVFGLRYTHPVSSSTTERVGLDFIFIFLKFYLEY
jgi:hypothetical protein